MPNNDTAAPDPDTVYDHAEGDDTRSKPASRTDWGRRILTGMLVLAVVLQVGVGVLLLLTRAETSEYTTCVGQWQQDFSVAYRARLADAVATSKATDRVFFAFAASVNTGKRGPSVAALQNYREVREAQDQGREKNPLPPLPETLCGKPFPGAPHKSPTD